MINSWKNERLFFDGDTYFQDIFDHIKKARTSIDIESYIFEPDPLGRALEKALIDASQRGVRVRILVDGIGASSWIDRRDPNLESAGIEIRIFHPIKTANLFSHLMVDLGLRKPNLRAKGSLMSRLNRRTHRKICLIDSEIAWVGSFNISSLHCFKYAAHEAWRDTGVAVEGGALNELKQTFDYVWSLSHNTHGERYWLERFGTKKIQKTSFSLLRLNTSRKIRWKNLYQLSMRLRRANARIWITNAYLAPSGPIIRRLIKAARRGVDVRVLVPSRSDVFFMPWITRSYYNVLTKSGVKIYEYLPRFLHAKVVMIDDWCIVGSSNLNRRSFLHDFEVDVVLVDPRSIELLERQFLVDLKESKEIYKGKNIFLDFLGRLISSLLKNWI